MDPTRQDTDQGRVNGPTRAAKSDTLAQQLLRVTPAIILLLSPDGRIEHVNPAFERLTGWSLADLRGREWFSLLPERDRDRIRLLFASAVGGTATRGNVNPILTRTGEEREIEWHDQALRDESGAQTGLVAVGIDVTERKRAEDTALRSEQALRQSETRLRQAQAIARIGNWELDLPSGHLWWSDEIYRIFERDPASFTASYEAFLAAIHPGDRERVNAAYTSSLTTREPYHITHRLVTPGGRLKYVEERCETDFADEGTALRSRGTVQDITERVRGEEALRSSLREKEILLREVHHRVKNNLQVISGLLHFQAKKVKHADDLAAFEDARQRLRSMSLVHERLYRASDLSAVDMPDYLASLAVAVQQSHAARAPVTVSVVCDPLRLPVDVAMPLGLLANELLTNVLKHAFPDERPGEAELRLAAGAGQLTMSVRDDGCGWRSSQLPDAAASFGWQLIRALTDQLGGDLWVTVDRGTCVTIQVAWANTP